MMDSEHLRHSMRSEATRTGRLTAQAKQAIVDGVDPDKHTVRVRFQPEDVPSGWLPVQTISIGGAWAVHWLPPVGAQVVVSFQEGSGENGIVTGCVYDDAHPAPKDVPVGAAWLVHKNARVTLNADGSVDIRSSAVRIGGMEAAMRRLLKEEAATVYNSHTHPSLGSPPTQKILSEHLTTNLTAS